MTVFAFYLYGADHQLFFLDKNVFDIQGVHEIVFFSKILKYIPDSGRSRFSSFVYTDDIMAGRTPALQQN